MLQKHQLQETTNSIRQDVQALKKRGLTLGESSYVELPFSPEGERVRFLLYSRCTYCSIRYVLLSLGAAQLRVKLQQVRVRDSQRHVDPSVSDRVA